MPIAAHAQAQIRSLSEVINGHSTGGVSLDQVGNLYIADFADTVWKITPDGERRVFAFGFYGASGNTIDNAGNLLQSSFYGNSVTKINRKGEATPFVTSGLNGPVGITVNAQTGEIYVANCRGNSIAKVAPDGTATPFAKSDLFRCPNGIALDRDGTVYTVNFRDNKMFKVDAKGAVTQFATITEKGLGHLCFKGDRFYVTATQSHAIYEVMLDGKSKRVIGTSERGVVDGPQSEARLSFPNGIACHPFVPRLYINEFVNDSVSSLPPRATIREILLEPAHASTAESSTTPARNALFEQLIGTWDVRYEYMDKDSKARSDAGQVHYRWILDGQALHETWTAKSAKGEQQPFGTTIDYYDPKRQRWTAVWVYPSEGTTLIMTGGDVNGSFVLTGHNESGALERWSTSIVDHDSIVIRAETTSDDGKSWQPLGVSHLQRHRS